MIDYEQLERDHQRRVNAVLNGNQSPRERQRTIEALVRFRDTDITTAERLEREAGERVARAAKEQTLAARQRQLDAESDLLWNALGVFLALMVVAFVGAMIWAGIADTNACAIDHVQAVCNSLNGR